MMKRFVSAAAMALAVTAVPVSTVLGAEAEDLIKYRKNVMKVLGGHTGSLFAIAGSKAGDASHMEAHVRGLSAAAMMIKDVFPPESAEGETATKPEAWSDAEGFAAAVNKLEEAAAGVQGAFDSNGDMGAALKALGGSCKGCHDDYRVKND